MTTGQKPPVQETAAGAADDRLLTAAVSVPPSPAFAGPVKPASQPAPADPPSVDKLSSLLRDYVDVTERLQRTHEALQHEVLHLRNELAHKDRELELRRRLAALGELAAGVAHEVRNPLGAIQLYSGLLRHQCQRHQLEGAVDLVSKIEAGIQAIDAVVQDTLALAPKDRRLAPCHVADLVSRARDATVKTLATCRVALDVRLASPDLAVTADADGLQRVLVNLIVNAAEASPPGRVIHLTAKEMVSGEVELRVRDEGSGIPEEIRHRIFDPFFTTKQHGTGLGLTIAHRLVEAYGGQLRANNRPGGGAEFVIVLPVARAAGTEDAPPDAAQQTSAA